MTGISKLTQKPMILETTHKITELIYKEIKTNIITKDEFPSIRKNQITIQKVINLKGS